MRRRSPLSQLSEALDDPSIDATEAISPAQLCDLRAKARDLNSRFNLFETACEGSQGAKNSRSHEMLLELVQTAEAFASKSLTSMIVVLQSSRTIDPSTKTYLPQAIEKLARYSTASRYLVSIARKRRYSVFNNIEVQSISIQPPNEHFFQKPFSNFEQAIRRVISANVAAHERRTILPLLSHLEQTYREEAREFQDRISAESKLWKVHAEIQLLVYHELHPNLPKPRVIASSKSACYLCNLFLNLHGQFQTSRAHGRIYDRWLLPDWVNFMAEQRQHMSWAAAQLNSTIEKKIIDTLNVGKKSYNHPNESRLFPVAQTSLSTLSLIQLATPLPSRPPSRTSLRTPTPTLSLGKPSLSQMSLLGMDTIIEGQTLSAPRPSPASAVGRTSSQVYDTPLVLPSESTGRSISISKISLSEDHEMENIKHHIVEGTEAEASIVQGQPLYTFPQLSTRAMSDFPSNIPSPRPSSDESEHRDHVEGVPSSMTAISKYPHILEHVLAGPGQFISACLPSPTSEICVEAGNLHLNLSRDVPSSSYLQRQLDCTVNVEWISEQKQDNLADLNKPRDIVNAREIAAGEAVTVDRGGWHSETDLLISCGRQNLLSIRFAL